MLQSPRDHSFHYSSRSQSRYPHREYFSENSTSASSRVNAIGAIQITSFGGLDLEAKYGPHQLPARHDHLPIAPSKTHPDNGKLLVLKDPSCELRKKSYVKTKNKHTILLASLIPYNRHGPEVFLSAQSYKVLVEHIQYTEPSQAPLLEASPDRYADDAPEPFGWENFRKCVKKIFAFIVRGIS